MLHYLMHKALAEERTRDLVAVAKRHQLVAAAIADSRSANESASRLAVVAERMVALFNGRRGVRARSNVASVHGSGSSGALGSAAGPMGCSA